MSVDSFLAVWWFDKKISDQDLQAAVRRAAPVLLEGEELEIGRCSNPLAVYVRSAFWGSRRVLGDESSDLDVDGERSSLHALVGAIGQPGITVACCEDVFNIDACDADGTPEWSADSVEWDEAMPDLIARLGLTEFPFDEWLRAPRAPEASAPLPPSGVLRLRELEELPLALRRAEPAISTIELGSERVLSRRGSGWRLSLTGTVDSAEAELWRRLFVELRGQIHEVVMSSAIASSLAADARDGLDLSVHIHGVANPFLDE